MSDQTITTIIINGRPHEWDKAKICFEELVRLVFEEPPYGEYTGYVVAYMRAKGAKEEGTLEEGECVNVHEGMIFDVTATDKS